MPATSSPLKPQQGPCQPACQLLPPGSDSVTLPLTASPAPQPTYCPHKQLNCTTSRRPGLCWTQDQKRPINPWELTHNCTHNHKTTSLITATCSKPHTCTTTHNHTARHAYYTNTHRTTYRHTTTCGAHTITTATRMHKHAHTGAYRRATTAPLSAPHGVACGP